ncbi:hypothetical protein BX257_3390 [Streptomyces sp. 3212.3]|uniref:DUF7660 family protein n=1 Tax=Streptomyces sp. NRRL F-5122 TaxID=1609098 RepID=UPI000E3A9113|nr:hypothetical protein BX257_3390 [Streptomyces sp. 3212.3]
MRRSHSEGGSLWENAGLASFLEALAGWIDDADGWYTNSGLEMPPGGDWKFFARALQAATVYE